MRFGKIMLTAAAAALMLLTSCAGIGASGFASEEKKEAEGYSAAQMYVIMAGRRQEVSEVYGEEIFGVRTDDTGSVFEDTFSGMMEEYLIKLHHMKNMGIERGIELSATESKVIETRTSEFMKELEASGNTAAITSSDITMILGDLLKIERLRSRIMEEADVEVSESDARMADIILIELTGAEEASETLRAVEEGTDFLKLALKNSVDPNVERTVGAGDLEYQLEEAVFQLEDGEVTPILRSGGRYYIIKCVRGYNEEATAVRKEEITQQRLRQSLGGEYEKYTAEHEYKPDEEKWKEALRLLKENPAIPDIFSFTLE